MNKVIYIGVVLYIGWWIYQFPLFELHRGAHRRNVEVLPSIRSLESVRLFCRWVFGGVLYFSSAILWMIISFAPPYYLQKTEIVTAPSGWWVLLYGIFFLGWMMITGSAFLVVLTLLSSKLKDINQPLDSINRRVEELKSQPAPLFKSKPETPTLVRRMRGFLGLNRYNTFEERYSDEMIQPSKPLPLKYLIYALLAVFLSLPLVLSVLDGDWSKLRLYWVIPMFLFGLALFLYAGGFAFSIVVNIILIPLNIYFEHSTKPEPYLLFACKNLLKFDENDHILPFLGIIFWGCIAIFVNYDVKPLVFLHWLFRG